MKEQAPRRPASILGLIAIFLVACAAGVEAREPDFQRNAKPQLTPSPSVYVYVSDSARVHAPDGTAAPVIVMLHGIGGNGRGFARWLCDAADQHGWVLISPTFRYGDWRDPARVVQDDLELTKLIAISIDRLSAKIGNLPTKSKVHLFGFSRGAQVAHRFAMFYPERVSSVVAFSAGTYTMPWESFSGRPALLPFGVADLRARLGHDLEIDKLRQIPFLIGVGEADANLGDVPRQWDRYVGKTRVDRATSFAQTLSELGVPVELVVFPGAGHALRADMIRSAVEFIASAEIDRTPYTPTTISLEGLAPVPFSG